MKISFCIPTYNHAAYLGAALDALLAQRGEEDEIVIVDGASTDDTNKIVMAYQERHERVRYFRRDENVGIDRDIEEAVRLADGDYVWLTSSDDVVPHGTVARVREVLVSGRSLYIGPRCVCTAALVPFGVDKVLAARGGTVWSFGSQREIGDYLCAAGGLMALFSYISILVIRREFWNSCGDNTEFFGTCYAHAARLMRGMREQQGTVEYVDAVLALCRMDTDNFARRGVFRRFMLDFEGYEKIASSTFSEPESLHLAFLAAIRREHGLLRLGKFFARAKEQRIEEMRSEC